MGATTEELEEFTARVRSQLERRLSPWLEERIAEARARGADVGAVADAIGQLALRGGKRMRPVLLAAAFEGCGGDLDGAAQAAAVAQAGVALELLQAYLLVHDDWIDGDPIRRGGPSVPAMMRGRFAEGRADAMSVLAGDLASAWAQRALLEVALPSDRVVSAARELARMQEEVVQGQVLDVGGVSRDGTEVEAMHELKTASYSVRGPVVMGASLAGAAAAQVAALAAFATPLGVAFQLRDDLLGVFGDATTMGKAAGGDLRAGKRTSVVVAAMGDARASEVLLRVMGRPEATEQELRAAVAGIEACGVRAHVENRIAALVHLSRTALERAHVTPRGRALLSQAATALTERQA